MKNLYLIVALFCCAGLTAQNNLQNANWLMAEQGGLNFVTGSPLPQFSNITGVVGTVSTAAVSDQSGNLLFYTNGSTVWDASHNVMTNGTGLLCRGADYAQNIMIVPNPADINKYYIIIISAALLQGSLEGLRYTEVDMTPGAEKVVALTKNTPLLDEFDVPIDDVYANNFGKITTAKHANGLDYWLIAEIGSEIYSYLVDDTGITLTEISPSPLPPSLYIPISGFDISSCNGPMKISPDNQQILIGYSFVDDPTVFNRLYHGVFNPATGAVSDYLELQVTANCLSSPLAGAEFSPNSSVIHRVYVSFTVSSEVTNTGPGWTENTPLEIFSPYGRMMQRSLDGKIYFEDDNVVMANAEFMAVIDDPDNSPYDIFYDAIDLDSTLGQSNYPPPWVQWQDCLRTLTTANLITASVSQERLNWIKATNTIDGAGVVVIYHAGDFVELNPGFETTNDAGFSAYILGCTDPDDFDYRNTTVSNPKTRPVDENPKKQKGKISIYPNPSDTAITIAYDAEKLKTITVMSLDGKVILTRNVDTNSEQVDVSAFAAGIYLITVQTQNGKLLNSKFVKN